MALITGEMWDVETNIPSGYNFASNTLSPTGLSGPITFTRSTTAIYRDAARKFQIAAVNAPRFDSDSNGVRRGMLIEGARTNKCTNYNFNPDAALTNISASAGTLDRVNDAANIPFSGGVVGGNVFHLNNTTGAEVTVTVVGVTGNTNPHSIRVFTRFTSTAPTLQLTGAAGAVACGNAYAETKSNNITPLTAADQWQLVIPAGTEVWFLGCQLEEAAFVSSPIETSGLATIRASDLATSSVITPLPPEWALVIDGISAPGIGPTDDQHLFDVNDETTSNRFRISRSAGSRNLSVVSVVGGVQTIGSTISSNFPDSSRIKISLTVLGSSVRVSANGAAAQIFTGTVASTIFKKMSFGKNISNVTHLHGWLKGYKEFRSPLSDAELVAQSTL